MHRKAIGFYWTLPVPWAGFREINEKDVDEAARQSRTIDLQRSVIRRWAKENGTSLIHEEVFIEISPDRGSALVRDRLHHLIARAESEQAIILFVDFGRSIGQRSHHYLRAFVGANIGAFQDIALAADQEAQFSEHFASWRKQQREWTDGKEDRAARARRRASELRDSDMSLTAIASQLNEEKLPSPTGKLWTGDNLGKLLKSG